MKRSAKYKLSCLVLFTLLFTLTPGAVMYSQGGVLSQQNPTESVTITPEQAELFQVFSEVQDFIREYHTKDVSLDLLYKGAIKGMVEILEDRYSQYFTPEQLEAWVADLEGEYGGIGVTIELIDGMLMVMGVFPGSPAQHVGLKAGDVIVSVEGNDMRGKLPNDAAVLLRGDPDTSVEAVFLRPSTGELMNVELVRAKILQPSMEVNGLGDGLHYMKVMQFSEEAGRSFPLVIESLLSLGMKGLVLDLRDNPGGLVGVCVEMAAYLVPKGPIVELARKDLKDVIENPTDTLTVPIAVLTNGGTASASEILAGAIRDRGVGVLVGEKTFGKGSVQSLVELDQDLGGVKLTIAEYRTPSGYAIEGKGLEPDYPVDVPEAVIPIPPNFTRPVKQGMVGLDVLAVQQNLSFLGYEVGELDGIYGPKTANAITAFCKDHDIRLQGYLDEGFMDMLTVACIQKVKDAGDPVKERGIQLLKDRIQTGEWE